MPRGNYCSPYVLRLLVTLQSWWWPCIYIYILLCSCPFHRWDHWGSEKLLSFIPCSLATVPRYYHHDIMCSTSFRHSWPRLLPGQLGGSWLLQRGSRRRGAGLLLLEKFCIFFWWISSSQEETRVSGRLVYVCVCEGGRGEKNASNIYTMPLQCERLFVAIHVNSSTGSSLTRRSGSRSHIASKMSLNPPHHFTDAQINAHWLSVCLAHFRGGRGLPRSAVCQQYGDHQEICVLRMEWGIGSALTISCLMVVWSSASRLEAASLCTISTRISFLADTTPLRSGHKIGNV